MQLMLVEAKGILTNPSKHLITGINMKKSCSIEMKTERKGGDWKGALGTKQI